MLSRRAFLLSALAASATLSTGARSQGPPADTGGQSDTPTVLRLERRTIEVNRKPTSVFGIRQPDGTFGLRTEVGRWRNGPASSKPLARFGAMGGALARGWALQQVVVPQTDAHQTESGEPAPSIIEGRP